MRNAKITSTPTFPYWTFQKVALYTRFSPIDDRTDESFRRDRHDGRQTRERGQKARVSRA